MIGRDTRRLRREARLALVTEQVRAEVRRIFHTEPDEHDVLWIRRRAGTRTPSCWPRRSRRRWIAKCRARRDAVAQHEQIGEALEVAGAGSEVS